MFWCLVVLRPGGGNWLFIVGVPARFSLAATDPMASHFGVGAAAQGNGGGTAAVASQPKCDKAFR